MFPRNPAFWTQHVVPWLAALALELFSQNHADLAFLPLVQGESWPGLNGHGHHFIMPNSWGNDWNDDVLFV